MKDIKYESFYTDLEREAEMKRIANREHHRDMIKVAIFGALGLIGVAGAMYCGIQVHQMKKLVGGAVKHISDMTEVTVQDALVENAISNAAAREANNVASRVMRSVEKDISEQTAKKISDAVAQSYSKIKSGVAETVAKKVADIDIHEIQEEATEKAKEMLLSKFDGKLDGLMTDYQRNLDNVGKIYQSIAASMADKAGKDVTFKLG